MSLPAVVVETEGGVGGEKGCGGEVLGEWEVATQFSRRKKSWWRNQRRWLPLETQVATLNIERRNKQLNS